MVLSQLALCYEKISKTKKANEHLSFLKFPTMASVATSSMLKLYTSSSLRSFVSENRFQKDITVGDLKVFLEF